MHVGKPPPYRMTHACENITLFVDGKYEIPVTGCGIADLTICGETSTVNVMLVHTLTLKSLVTGICWDLIGVYKNNFLFGTDP